METTKELTITCAYGVRPRLLELEQHSTYRGLLDGAPTHELNQMLIRDITRYPSHIPTYLVRPTERVVERKQPSRARQTVLLPRRQCTALFDVGGRWLTIVWFQEGWAPPIDSLVLEDLQTLDFLAIAFDEVGSW